MSIGFKQSSRYSYPQSPLRKLLLNLTLSSFLIINEETPGAQTPIFSIPKERGVFLNKEVMPKVSPPLTCWLCPCTSVQGQPSLCWFMSSSTASTLLSSAVLLPSQSVYRFLPWGCYPGRSVSNSGLFMTLGKPPTTSCFQNSPRTSILFFSSPSRVSPFCYLSSLLSPRL